MFVLSAEGQNHVNKGLWSTHVILGAFPTKELAIQKFKERDFDLEEIVLLTNLFTGDVERLGEAEINLTNIAK